MRKRCKDHGWFEALLSTDFETYRSWERFNKPGTMPLEFQTKVKEGCPTDCGLCPAHQQHTCLGILEITNACNFECPVCFASSVNGPKQKHLDLTTVKSMVDTLIKSEGIVDLIQISGGEPTLHPKIINILEYIKNTGKIKRIMLNTNGRKFSKNLEFCKKLQVAGLKHVYLQFDGFSQESLKKIRGNSDLIPEKVKAIENLTQVGVKVTLAMTIIKDVNDHEIGKVINFMHETPGVLGLALQPVFAEGRLMPFYDPMDHLTMPDILERIEDQTNHLYLKDDFFPIPCPYPHCSGATFSYRDPETKELTTLKRLVEIEDYLDYFKDTIVPDPESTIKDALEKVFSFSTSPGSKKLVEGYCQACGIDLNIEAIVDSLRKYADHVRMITIKPFMSVWDVDIKRLMKCCVHEVLPDGKIMPFCSYNILYRDKYHETYFR